MSEIGSELDLAGRTAGSRRLIAVVYADMVGYSRLISLDDAGTLRRLRTLRRALIDPTIREYGGRVVQTGGDSLLIAFDSIDGAVRCAVKVQQQVPVYDGDQPPDRRIRFRIGINIGDVIPDGTDLHGDGVNVAARLEAECPVGGICVSRSVRDHVHGRLDLNFEAVGPLTLKNIARPVEAFVLRLDPAGTAGPANNAWSSKWVRSQKSLVVGFAGLLLVAAGVSAWWLAKDYGSARQASQPATTSASDATHAYTTSNVGLATAPRLSIVVMPFESLSGDPTDKYLAEGVTEDITTDLSRMSGMFVIARESAYAYQGKATDVRKIGEALGVRYVLEGSVRRLEDSLRVNAQLISAETGAHLWADRFDQKLSDLSAGQEAIVTHVGQSLNIALTDIESARSKRERPTSPDVFDLILRARSLLLHPMGPQEHAQRRELLEQALKIDPSSVIALTSLAYELMQAERLYGQGEGDLDRAANLVSKAASNSPDSIGVLNATAYLAYAKNHYSEALSGYLRLLDEYPNSAGTYALVGYCHIFLGQFEDGISDIELALRRDPFSPYNYDRFSSIGWAMFALGRDEEAIAWTQRALAAVRSNFTVARAIFQSHIAAASARLGRMDEAHAALAEATKLWPYDTVRSHAPLDLSSREYAELVRRTQAALRLAGLRDHAEEDADFGVPADGDLRLTIAGLTPTTAPGVTTVRTADLRHLIDEKKPLVIDSLSYTWGLSIPGAVGLNNAGHGGNTSDTVQDRLRRKMQVLTKGDSALPIVAVGWNSERFDGRNLALRLVALGYTNIYWYRGGREAWEVAGLPETPVDMQDW